MADPMDIEKKRLAEQRLAMLALTGSAPEQADGPCLSEEELACLVEGKTKPEHRERCFTHLAGCERCYAAWRQLDQEWQHQTAGSKRGKLLTFLSRPRVLTATGSLLALAASIAVFLNITMHADRQALLQLPASPAQRQEAIPPPAPLPAAPEHSKASEFIERSAAPAPPPLARQQEKTAGKGIARVEPTLKATAPKKMDRQAADPAAREFEQMTPQTAPRVEEEKAAPARSLDQAKELSARAKQEAAPAPPPRAMEAPAGQASNRADSQPTTVEEWRRKIRNECRGPLRPELLTSLSAQGRQLLTMPSAALTPHDRQQMHKMLAILDDQQQSVAQRCQALLPMLRSAAGSASP